MAEYYADSSVLVKRHLHRLKRDDPATVSTNAGTGMAIHSASGTGRGE